MTLKITHLLADPARQLELVGFEQASRLAAVANAPPAVRTRMERHVTSTYRLLSEMPTDQDISFQHAGLCQTFLPHRRPKEDHMPWRRESGRFTLWVRPGLMREKSSPRDHTTTDYVGVPFGPKARLILIYLQTEGSKGREVYLGKNLADFLRSLNLPRTGGPRGSITQVKEQFKRIARCSFTMQFDGDNSIDIQDTQLVDGLRLWNMSSDDWTATVYLSENFQRHLVDHAVPLDRRAIAHLAHNSLGLDLYALMAYRLPRLRQDLRLSWERLQGQIGSDYGQTRDLSRAVRQIIPELKVAYPNANIEIGKGGLILKPSKPAVPRTTVNGFSVIDGRITD